MGACREIISPRGQERIVISRSFARVGSETRGSIPARARAHVRIVGQLAQARGELLHHAILYRVHLPLLEPDLGELLLDGPANEFHAAPPRSVKQIMRRAPRAETRVLT
jgi:hypothetical protein